MTHNTIDRNTGSDASEAAFDWDLGSDRMTWEPHARELLSIAEGLDISQGRGFEALIAAEHVAARARALPVPGGLASAANGNSYRLKYRLRPGGPRTSLELWVEERGCWWPDETGLPRHVHGVIRLIDDRYWEERRELERTELDPATGLLNRGRLTSGLEAAIARALRTETACAMLVARVDNVAAVNDAFGHAVGDEVIAAVGRILRRHMRGGDTIGRYSSNVFGMVLAQCDAGSMRVAAERLMEAVRSATIQTSVSPLAATVSVGAVLLPEHALAASGAIDCSLEALETTHRHDTLAVFDTHAREHTRRRRNADVTRSVMGALAQGRMHLALQPLISAATGAPAMYEGLIRMRLEDGTLVSAAEFMPIAEELGLSRQIDLRALELTLALLDAHPELRLAVNVSGLTLDDVEWLGRLRAAASDPLLASRLVVEITETAMIHDIDLAARFVDEVRALGCKVALDDFGAGYTSFKNLKTLRVDIVKIDGSFVRDLASDPSGRVFIETMIEIASAFGIETVAEWVGDADAEAFLKQAGITYLQGFYYAEPRLAEDLGLLLAS